jgi:hypothetical protein
MGNVFLKIPRQPLSLGMMPWYEGAAKNRPQSLAHRQANFSHNVLAMNREGGRDAMTLGCQNAPTQQQQ